MLKETPTLTLAPSVNDVPPAPAAPPAGTPPAPRLTRLTDLLSAWDEDAQKRRDSFTTGEPLGPLSGLPRLDQALGGALAPGLHILHGVPGIGKTAFALQLAASCGCPCLYVTCEMAPLELLRRIAARVTSTFLGKFKSGELAPEESGRHARRAVAEAANLSLLDATSAPLSPAALTKADPPGLFDFAEATKASGDARHLLIVVDSLHSWAEGCWQGAQEYEALNAGLSALRGIGARLSCPVLAVAERNRASMEKGELHAGAGSRKIEYGAETVIDLGAEKNAEEDGNGERAVTIKIAKNRNGPAGKEIPVKFHGAFQRYTEAGP